VVVKGILKATALDNGDLVITGVESRFVSVNKKYLQ
jgi:hypothetical protein